MMKGTEELWRSADGKQLPPIDKEVVALVGTDYPPHYRVVFAHRVDPNNFGSFGYGIGGWNIPYVKYWLDAELPNMNDY